MPYRRYWNADTLAKSLDMDPVGDILIDLSEDEVFPNSHDDPKRSIQTSSYWESLSEEDRADRLTNHGMTGKKHSAKTRKLMSENMTGTSRPTLHKSVTLIKDGVINEFVSQVAASKYIGDSVGHVNELTKGIRKSCKGWRLYGV